MVLCQGAEAAAVPPAAGKEPEGPRGWEDGADAGRSCLQPAPGVEAADAEERRVCGCCPGSPWPRCCKAPGTKKKTACPGLGLFYTLLSAFLFSVASLFLKKIEDVHSVENRVFGTKSSPVFTSLLAWIFLKEKYSIWDLLFTLFTITGVILIARPPFLFGSNVTGIEGSYSDHLKGTIAAIASTVSAASTIVILRKVGKSVHYFLSIWYYAVIGLIGCVIALFVMNEWRLPYCGKDRVFLILIGILGLGGQIFLTKALQIEKAGPVAIMRTMDVVFAFILQILFLNHLPTWWTVGGALCVVASSSGTAIRKWKQSSKKAEQNEI
ncbi:solute carrier family 35 member G1 isoform X6 [Numida meleagris]|uniref:solute carrier family 35 member G1 isoform X6 n=1 Tax=Numida meleagris TaxID=8996 RepID=UPI000B3E150E|nr:solute carrier family 35 member G1 isoform X6 [Numida meleagris]